MSKTSSSPFASADLLMQYFKELNIPIENQKGKRLDLIRKYVDIYKSDSSTEQEKEHAKLVILANIFKLILYYIWLKFKSQDNFVGDDIIQSMMVQVLVALEKFDPSKNIPFHLFIKNYMKDGYKIVTDKLPIVQGYSHYTFNYGKELKNLKSRLLVETDPLVISQIHSRMKVINDRIAYIKNITVVGSDFLYDLTPSTELAAHTMAEESSEDSLYIKELSTKLQQCLDDPTVGLSNLQKEIVKYKSGIFNYPEVTIRQIKVILEEKYNTKLSTTTIAKMYRDALASMQEWCIDHEVVLEL